MEPLVPSDGWMLLHLFTKARAAVDEEVVRTAVKTLTESEHQVVPVSMLGHKADACFMVLGPNLSAMREFQTQLQRAGLEIVDSFLSVTEVSEYAGEHMTPGMRRGRLFPPLDSPEHRAWCFYPMNKRRWENNNWFTLDFEKRKELLYEHGMSGRNFGDRVLQVVTASTGLDDWEWGVTLFALHPNDLKDCVYTMRYDEASAKYGEFGPFYTGIVGSVDEVLANLVP